MTITIRAKVGRFPKAPSETPCAAKPWLVTVYKHDPDQDSKPHDSLRIRREWFYSLPEALQGMWRMRAKLAAELMDEVHASRATRRSQRCGACRDLSQNHIYRGDCLATEPTA